MTTYVDLIASLPLPSLEETARLLEDFVNARDWREGLSFAAPERRLVFFLNPNAGEIHSLSQGAYRERFGCWDYHVVCGLPPVLYDGYGGFCGVDDAGRSHGAPLVVRDDDGNPVTVPQRVVVHCGLALSDALLEGPEPDLAAGVWKTLQTSRRYLASLRAIKAALDHFLALADLRDVPHGLLRAVPLVRMLLAAPDYETSKALREECYGWPGISRGGTTFYSVFLDHALHNLALMVGMMETHPETPRQWLVDFFENLDKLAGVRRHGEELLRHQEDYARTQGALAEVGVVLKSAPPLSGELLAWAKVLDVLFEESGNSGSTPRFRDALYAVQRQVQNGGSGRGLHFAS